MPTTITVSIENLESGVQTWKDRVQDNLLEGLRQTSIDAGKEITALADISVSAWADKPKFETPYDVSANEVTLYLTTDSIPWNVADMGDHRDITAKNPSGKMTFLSDYFSATIPGQLENVGKAIKSGSWVKKGSVHHHVEARHFRNIIGEKLANKFIDLFVANLQKLGWAGNVTKR